MGDNDEQNDAMTIDHFGELIRPVLHEFPDTAREGQSDLFARLYGVGRGREFIRPVVAEASAKFFEDRKINKEWFMNRLFDKGLFEKTKSDRSTSEPVRPEKPSAVDETIPPGEKLKIQKDGKMDLVSQKWAEGNEEKSLPELTKMQQKVNRPAFSAQIKAAQEKYHARNNISIIKNYEENI
jgi:hypothetical protein